MKDDNSKNKTGDNSSKRQNDNEKSNGSNSEPRFRMREVFNESDESKLKGKNIPINYKKLR